jgi:uncharacterized protein
MAREPNNPGVATPSTSQSALQRVSVDQLIRSGQGLSGACRPRELTALVDFLATDRGEITFELRGKLVQDQLGSEKKRLQCIISGWFEVLDAITLTPTRFSLDIDSRVVLVSSEDQLPPLETEPDDEDYIVCGQEFDVLAHVQEEVLLALPTSVPRTVVTAGKPQSKTRSAKAPVNQALQTERESSPFAKLSALRKVR